MQHFFVLKSRKIGSKLSRTPTYYVSLRIFAKLELTKEIVERRHGEPIKFLFLPKMGLLGSQAGNEKNCWL